MASVIRLQKLTSLSFKELPCPGNMDLEIKLEMPSLSAPKVTTSQILKENLCNENNNTVNEEQKAGAPIEEVVSLSKNILSCNGNDAEQPTMSTEVQDSRTLKRAHPTSDPSEPSPKRAVPSKKSNKFIYGNYDRYYGYRNPKDFHDIRLDAFSEHRDTLFRDADILDIGCNNGLITIAVARDLGARSANGVDIDKQLIGRARKQLAAERRRLPNSRDANSYPNNIWFSYGNYVLNNPALLDLEQPKFDTILCLSITKWIHLNFGDGGLRLAFRRMFRQLRPGGQLVLEAQPWKSYMRRKKLTDTIATHFRAIRMQPHQFEAFLLGPEVGFERSYMLAAAENHAAQGFRRPIQVFVKAAAQLEMRSEVIGSGAVR